MVPFLGNAA
jgi:hypothetical protein